MTDMIKPDTQWHLDKRVPVAIILALLMQTAGALVWAGAASERLSTLEGSTQSLSQMNVRTARLEEQVNYMRATLDRIEDKLDRSMSPPSNRVRP